MRKTNKNLTKQILTLVLTFVMVFTGMGIGSWGVDMVWADQTTTQQIVVTASGVEQYDQCVTSSIKITSGNSKIPAESEAKEREVYILTLESADDVIIVNKTGKLALKYQCYVTETGVLAIGSAGKNLINSADSTKNLKTSTQAKIGSTGFSTTKLNTEAYSFYFFYFNFGTAGDIDGGKDFALLIQIVPPKNVDKNALNAAIAAAPDTSDSMYHHENDRWNGSQYSKKGFWADLQAVIDAAKAVYNNENATQEKVNVAAKSLDRNDSNSALSKAIKNLIPTSQFNTTALYEAVNTEWVWTGDNQLKNKADVVGGFLEPVSADTCTLATWTPYAQAVSKADALLKELFDKDKNATQKNNSADSLLKAEIEKIVTAADETKLVRQSAYDYAYTYYQNNKAEMEALLTQYDPKKLTEQDYTPDSWKRYTDAYTALKQTADYRIVGGTTEDYAVLRELTSYSVYDENEGRYILHPAQITELKEARRQLVSTEDVTVSLTYVNNFSALYPAFLTDGTNLYVNKTVTFKKDNAALTTETLKQAGITFDLHDDRMIAAGAYNTSDTSPFFLIFINGENYGIFRDTVLNTANLQLHNGDEVRVVRICQPIAYIESSTGYDSSVYDEGATYNEKHYQDSIAQIHMSAPKTVKVGDKVSFTAAVTGVNTTNQGKALEADQISLFISEPQQDGSLAEPTVKTKALTDADGKLEYVFTKPGSYTVAMYKVVTDKFGSTSIYNKVTAGEYYSLYAGDYMQITVEAADEDALLKQYRSENLAKAKAFYESFQAQDFAAGYYDGEFKDAYDKLKTNQTAADTFEALMKRFEEDYAELETCAQQKVDHAAIIADLRTNLSYLPESSDQWDSNDKTVLQTIKEAYQNLNSYQKTLLSSKEISTLDEIVAYDLSSLPPQATVQVKLVPQGEFLSATGNGDTGAAQYGKPNQNRISHVHPDGSKTKEWYDEGYQPLMSVWEKTAHPGDVIDIWRYLKTNDTLYRPVWSSDGKTWHELKQTTLKDIHGGAYSDYYIAQIPITEDMAGGSLTITLKMVDKETYESMTAETPEQIAAAKDAALEALEAAYKAYKSGNYTDDNWTTLTAAYNKGKTDIGKAATTEAAAEARKAALAAMAAVPVKSTTTPGTEPGTIDFNSGKTVGKVHVIIENSVCPVTESSSKNGNKTEFDTKKAGLYGTFIDDWYDLGEKDTMMSCVLKALQLNGYGWEGTRGDGYGITYIAGIFNDTNKNGKLDANENILSEFDGGSGSGWMGTLNDWFNNEGFAAFTAKNGALENGDEIHIMYTTNLGVDIGGTWYNEDTSLKKLEVSGGTLSPAFSGSQTDYTLIISGDKANVSVTPSAANKNYQARIFLNRYNQDSARYKRTESISVKSGDVLYVGVGEKGWPTMNAGGVGTKYTIKVVSSSDSAAVDKMLKALKKITYANYKAEKGNVEAARAAYNALDAKGKQEIAAADLKKLTDAEAQIKFYSEIDDAKAKLAALPKLTNPTQAQANAYRSQINEATAAYKKLSAEQQKYITKADVENYNALAKALGVSTIVGADAAPESPVETSGKSGSATTTSPTEVKVSGSTAIATIKAEDQSEILKQAAENKSAEIVLEVAASDTKGAENVQLQLETSFVKNISDKTNASLTLDTENGRVSFDQEALKVIISEAKGSTILIEIAKVTKPTEAQKKAAGTNGDIFRLVMKSGDKIISDFNKGKVKVVAEIVSKLLDKKVAAIHIADDGKIEQLAGKVLTIGGKKYYEFTTPHFSTFALVDAEELGLEVEEPQIDAKALAAKLTPIARSAKTAKKNVKVTGSFDKQDKAIIKELKDAGYTVKYRFYRSTKKAAGYKAAVTKKTAAYTNTGGKKGTKYYYKVQVRVYDADGKLAAKTALKQCKYASRTWTKAK